jgi:hypothetical protein
MTFDWIMRQWLTLSPKTKQFFEDLKQIVRALGWWSGMFITAEVVLGLLPLAMVITLGAAVDAMIGARGIGVMTSDIQRQLAVWMILMLLGFFTYVFAMRFTGKAGSVGTQLRSGVTFSSLIIYLCLSRQIFLSFVYAILLVADVAFSDFPKMRIINLTLVVIIGMIVAQTFVRFTVFRAFTVGEGLSLAIAVTVFMIFYKLRLAHD